MRPSRIKEEAPARRFRPDSIKKFKVTAPGPLLAVASAILKDHTATKVKSMLRHRQFAVNGAPTTQFDRPVEAGDEFWVNFSGSFNVFSHPRLKLVYEDDQLLVVDKGYGLLSTAVPGKVEVETVYNVLRKYVRASDEQARIFMVHRLDRDTSGLMVVARTAKMRDAMLNHWNKMVTDRNYEAIVEGIVPDDSGLVQSYLMNVDNYEVASTDDSTMGDLAKTRYVVLSRGARNTHVRLSMREGHKNQLRVHMKDMGFPISGDRKYGGHSNTIHRLALHATHFAFTHPITGKEMAFESPIPRAFLDLL